MFATRALNKVVKRSTGIVGLPVDPRARETLVDLYMRTLQELKVRVPRPQLASGASPLARGVARVQQIPEDAFYRKSVESFTNFRLKTVQENEDVRGQPRPGRACRFTPPHTPHGAAPCAHRSLKPSSALWVRVSWRR